VRWGEYGTDGISWAADYFRYFDQALTTVIGSRKMPGRKIRPVNWYSIFLPHIFLLLSVGVELPNQYRLIFADELKRNKRKFLKSLSVCSGYSVCSVFSLIALPQVSFMAARSMEDLNDARGSQISNCHLQRSQMPRD
jgi:hypothetical protein